MTEEQRKFLVSIGIDPDEDTLKLIEDVTEYLQLHCITVDDELTEDGVKCDDILQDMAHDEDAWEAGRLRTKGE